MKNSGLHIAAFWEGESELRPLCEGYSVSVQMISMTGGDDSVVVHVRQGMAAPAAAHLLKRIADLIERDGQTLLNLDRTGLKCGFLREDGTIDWGEDDDGLP